MKGSDPATKQDIADLRAEIKADLKTEIDQLRSENSHQYDNLKESSGFRNQVASGVLRLCGFERQTAHAK